MSTSENKCHVEIGTNDNESAAAAAAAAAALAAGPSITKLEQAGPLLFLPKVFSLVSLK